MVYFERFRGTNAGPFKNFDLNLAQQGLVRMAGANGQGKSTTWHLFTQAALGNNPVKAKKSDLMLTEADYLLELTFSKNGSQYIAASATKSKTKGPNGKPYGTGVYLYRDGQDISMHRDPDTQKLIQETLGWTLEEWYGYVYLAQSSTHTLIEGTRSERQSYLSALFNLSPLDALSLYFKKKADALEEKIKDLEREKQEYAVKTSLLDGRSEEALVAAQQEANETHALLEAKLEKLQEEHNRACQVAGIQKELLEIAVPEKAKDELTQELKELENHRISREATLLSKSNLEAELAKIQAAVAPRPLTEEERAALDSPDIDAVAIRTQLQTLQTLKGSFQNLEAPVIPEDLEAVLQAPVQDPVKVQEKIRSIKNRPSAPAFDRIKPEQIEGLREKITTLNQDLAVLSAEIKTLTFQGDACPTCGSQLDCTDRGQKLQEKQEQFQETQDSLLVLKKKLVDLETRDLQWRHHDALGPDLSAELPELEAALLFVEKQKSYRNISRAAETYAKNQKDAEQLAAIPELTAKLNLWNLKASAKTLHAQHQQYEAVEQRRQDLQKNIQAIVIPEARDGELNLVRTSLQAHEKREMKLQALVNLGNPQDCSEKISLLSGERNEIQQTLGGIQRQLAEVRLLSRQITELQASIASKESLYREQTLYAILGKAYGKAGSLRERQLSRFSRYLESALLAHTIKQLPEHRFMISVDDGIDILASKNGGKPYDIKFMSGGEKGALSVAFLFALDDLLPPERRTNLKIVDEVEAGFDSERQQDFVQYTLPELKKRAETVVVISHSSAASHGAFDRIWEVKGGQIQDIVTEERSFSTV